METAEIKRNKEEYNKLPSRKDVPQSRWGAEEEVSRRGVCMDLEELASGVVGACVYIEYSGV